MGTIPKKENLTSPFPPLAPSHAPTSSVRKLAAGRCARWAAPPQGEARHPPASRPLLPLLLRPASAWLLFMTPPTAPPRRARTAASASKAALAGTGLTLPKQRPPPSAPTTPLARLRTPREVLGNLAPRVRTEVWEGPKVLSPARFPRSPAFLPTPELLEQQEVRSS